MKRIKSIFVLGTAIFLIIACSPAKVTILDTTTTVPQETATTPKDTVSPTTTRVTASIKPTDTLDPSPFPLSDPGPYMVGKRAYSLQDASRNNRPVDITVWYPALLSEGSSDAPFIAGTNRDPDLSGAPYPLILSSTKVAGIFAPYLISHGFAWASVNKIDTYRRMNMEMFEQPLDILFAFNQIAANPPEGLEGMIDAEHTGVIGYSFDGYNTLAMSGARIDPEYYLAQCPNPDTTTKAILSNLSSFHCGPADIWSEFTANAGKAITASEDGLWQPMTDVRIRAVMPLAAEGWWLFGHKGLAAVDRPTLIIAGTQDVLYPENVLIFNHLGTPNKSLISFIGPSHMMIYEPDKIAQMAHFAAAFFGYHLQNNKDYEKYFSEGYVSKQEGMAWGVYEE